MTPTDREKAKQVARDFLSMNGIGMGQDAWNLDAIAAALSEARKNALEECAPLLQEAYSAGLSDGHPMAASWQSEWPAIQEQFKALKERT
jgi:hypothetical protein